MKILNGVELTGDEEVLLKSVQELFKTKGGHDGNEFRYAFSREIMHGYCMDCGAPEMCYCIMDE